jgi:hypothetical protein
MNNDISYYPKYAITPRYVKYMDQGNQIKPSCICSDNISSIIRNIKSVATFTKSNSNSYVNFNSLNHRFKKLLNNFGSKKM